MRKIFICLPFLLVFICPSIVAAQVVINEFSSNSSPDWVEVYNKSEDEIDLSNYTLSDSSASGNTKNFSCILKPKGFYVVEWSNKLDNAGDIIYLKKDGSIVDCVSYGDGNGKLCDGAESVNLPAPEVGQSGARKADGENNWLISEQTKGYSNIVSQKPEEVPTCVLPTPTPTQALTPTPTPTLTPKPTVTPTPTSNPKTTLTPTPRATPTPTLKAGREQEELVLGGRSFLTPTPPAGEQSESGSPKTTTIAAVLIVLGGGLALFSAYLFFKKYLADYNKADDKIGSFLKD